MTSTSSDSRALASSLSKLNIASSSKKPKAAPVADSWEDEDFSDEDTETEEPSKHQRNLSTTSTNDDYGPSAPPPTPASPSGAYPDDAFDNPYKSLQPSRERGNGNRTPERRPEKTTSVAARMIAGSLGVRAPKRTEEQREFDRAVKEKEKKRRAEEKEKAEQEEKLRASVWED
jgi:hypothetical protein